MQEDACPLFESEIRIRYNSSREAKMMKDVIEVDEELQPLRIEKTIMNDGNYLLM